jgi:hypothetical protein
VKSGVGAAEVTSRKTSEAKVACMRVNPVDMLWMIRLDFVGDAAKANGPSATVAMCLKWIVVTNVAPSRLSIALVTRWCV